MNSTLYLAESEGEVRQIDSILHLFWRNEPAEDPYGWRKIDKGRIAHKARLISGIRAWETGSIAMRFAIECAERAIRHAETRIKKSHKWLDEMSFYEECLEFARAKNENDYQRLKEISGTDLTHLSYSVGERVMNIN